jgi:hypothetical protein
VHVEPKAVVAALLTPIELDQHRFGVLFRDAVSEPPAARSRLFDQGHHPAGGFGHAAMVDGALPESPRVAREQPDAALDERNAGAKNQRTISEDPERIWHGSIELTGPSPKP